VPTPNARPADHPTRARGTPEVRWTATRCALPLRLTTTYRHTVLERHGAGVRVRDSTTGTTAASHRAVATVAKDASRVGGGALYRPRMTVTATIRDPPAHMPSVAALAPFVDEAALVLLPNTLSTSSGRSVAGFRHGAQELRVAARQAGVQVEVLLPPGAEPGHYSEHDADWVLPLVLGVPASVIAGLIVGQIQAWLSREKRGDRVPTVRYREIFLEADRCRLREIEGPADEVIDWLKDDARFSTDGQTDSLPAVEPAGEEDSPDGAPS
jgi:hypothetical protein